MVENLGRVTLQDALTGDRERKALILRKIRNALNLTQKEMAELIDRDPSYLSLLENGKRNIQNEIMEDALAILAEKYKGIDINSAKFKLLIPHEFLQETIAYVETRKGNDLRFNSFANSIDRAISVATNDKFQTHSRLIENLKNALEQNERDEWILDRVLDSSLSDINSFFRDIDIIPPQDLNTTLDRISNSIKKQLTEAYREIRKDSVELLGYVAGGEPCDSIDLRDMVKLPKDVNADFALRVRGNSMLPSYRDGSIIFVKKQNSLENGQLGVFAIDSINHTFKKYHKEENRIRLESLNKDYEDIIIDKDSGVELTIVGRVL